MRGKISAVIIFSLTLILSTLAIQTTTSSTPATVTIAPYEILRPNAVGTFTQWSAYPSTPNWQCVDEDPHDSNTTYVYATATAKADSYNLQDTTKTYTVANVRVSLYTRQTTGNEALRLMLVISGVKYYGKTVAPPATGTTPTYTFYGSDWDKNPATTSTWATGEIDTLQAGFETLVSGSWMGEVQVTQLYVEITYAPTDLVYETGQSFTIAVLFTNVWDEILEEWIYHLHDWEVKIKYDMAILTTDSTQIKEGSYLKTLGATTYFPEPYFGPDYVMIGGLITTSAYVAESGGPLATITYTVADTGKTTLDLYDTSLKDPAGTPISHTAVDRLFYTTYPKAIFTFEPGYPRINETIVFNATTSYDPDGSIASYLWDFGDGTTSTDALVAHLFKENKTYTMSLTVTDNNGKTDTTIYYLKPGPKGKFPGDANLSGFVDVSDFTILAGSWFKGVGQPGYDRRADFNGSGFVDVSDFTALAGNWFKSAPPGYD